ncbi:MAG TPA: DUF2065 domain-containing protein [Casimicrobiaceae bacterium]|nr:DUF2065 domain-containing protein [Casimicrobiaceae bacterium]
MLEGLLPALAIVMIVEGALPFIAPRVWRQTFAKLIELNDGQIRFVGLIAIVIGVAGLLALSYA